MKSNRCSKHPEAKLIHGLDRGTGETKFMCVVCAEPVSVDIACLTQSDYYASASKSPTHSWRSASWLSRSL